VLNSGLTQHKGALENKTHLLKRAVQRIAGIVRPEDQDERIMRDTYSQLRLKLQDVATAVASKDAQKVNAGLKAIDKVGKEYLRAAQKRKEKRKTGFIQTSPEDPLAEFRALAQKIGHPAREAAQKGDESQAAELSSVTSKITTVAHGNNSDHVVDKIAAFQDIDATMAAIESAVERGDGERVTTLTKRLLKQMEVLPPIAEGETDVERKKELREAVVQLNERVRAAIQQAAVCIRNPDDETGLPQLGAAVDAARLPTARAIALLSPCEDRSVDEVLRAAQAAVSSHGAEAAASEIRKAIDVGTTMAAQQKNGNKRRHVEQAVTHLQETLLETLRGPDGEGATTLDVKEALEDLHHVFHASPKTDVVELAGAVKASANEIDATLKEAAKPGNALNKPAFEKKTTTLVNKMEDLRDSALDLSRGTAMPPTLQTSAATLDSYLDAIEKTYTPPKPAHKNVQEIIDSMVVTKEEPKTFEDALERAAVDIAHAVQNSSQTTTAPEVIASSGIASEMARLAKAARSGNKTEMMLASKAIAAHIAQLVNEINGIVTKLSKNPREADRLIRAATAMKNWGTQLKILTSVKAASIEKDNDNDETLLSVTKGLGNVVSDSIKTLDMCKTVILKQR